MERNEGEKSYSRDELLVIRTRINMGLISKEELDRIQINLIKAAVNDVRSGNIDWDFQDAAYCNERKSKDMGVDILPDSAKESIWLDKAIERRKIKQISK